LTGTQPLRLELSPSGVFAATILTLYAAASACMLLVLPGVSGLVLAGLLLALGAAAAWDRALLRGSRSPRAIEIHASGQALLVLRNGESAPMKSGGGVGVTRCWVALKTGFPARPSVLVAQDMLGREPFRLLRLWALWGRVPSVAPGQLRT